MSVLTKKSFYNFSLYYINYATLPAGERGPTFHTQTPHISFDSMLISRIPHYYTTSEVVYSPDRDAQLPVWII
jgi:hypothetical protein